MGIIKKVVKEIIYLLLSIVNYIVPLNKKLILLESIPPHGDNTGALFKVMSDNQITEKYKIIWLIKDNNKMNFESNGIFKTYGKISGRLFLVFLSMRAKYYFFSHDFSSDFKRKRNQFVVNLTHGTPIKNSTGRHPSQRSVTHLATTSDFASKLRIKTYSDFNGEILRLGFPRNDYFKKAKVIEGLIIWLPTYRKHHSVLSENEVDFFPLLQSESDFEKLDETLCEIDATLIIKPHPAQKIKKYGQIGKRISIISEEELKHSYGHLYSFLGASEILITDYSSVYMDYLLTDRPIIFTCDDISSYNSDTGFLVEDVFDLMPGAKINNLNELLVQLKMIGIEKKDAYSLERKRIRELFHENFDYKSSERILERLGIKNEKV